MLTRYKSLQKEETRKKYRKIGYDACLNGVDRRIADDFAVEHRSYIRQGWDEANADNLCKHLAELTIVATKKISQ